MLQFVGSQPEARVDLQGAGIDLGGQVPAPAFELADDLPVEERHFDRKGRLARTMRFDEVKLLGGRRLPSHIVLTPADTEGQKTEMRYLEVRFDLPISDDTFSLSRLEQNR